MTSTIKTNANTTTKTVKSKTSVPAASKSTTKLTATPKVSQAQIVQQRLDKRVKLNALYQDYDQLMSALRDFDSIQTYSDIRIVVYCGSTAHFKTSRHDTVQACLDNLEQSIKNKLKQVQADLAKFEF